MGVKVVGQGVFVMVGGLGADGKAGGTTSRAIGDQFNSRPSLAVCDMK